MRCLYTYALAMSWMVFSGFAETNEKQEKNAAEVTSVIKVDLAAERYNYDFGPQDSPLREGWVRITPDTAGDVRWSKGSVAARNRSGENGVNEINRDFVLSEQPAMLSHKISNGTWTVTLNMGDEEYSHDQMQVWAEGKRQGENIDSGRGLFPYHIFDVEVTDGQLDITFLDAGGADASWILNRMTLTKRNTNQKK